MAEASHQSKDGKRWALTRSLDLFPIRKTTAGYSTSHLTADSRAALNVALLAFPQGMAYAVIAGLPLSYGLFGSAVASIVGMLFAGSRFIVLGPTNATSVMVMSSFAAIGLSGESAVEHLSLLLVMVGLLLVIGAYLRIATLIQYISRSVITGYITAAAALIIANQIKKALGFEFSADAPATTFFEVANHTFMGLGSTHFPTLVLSIVTATIYLLLKRYAGALPNVALTLTLSSLIAFIAHKISPELNVALMPSLNLSEWGFSVPRANFDSINLLLTPAIAIALLCVLEGNSIGKSLAAREGNRLDSNQEMLSSGIANIACGLLSGMAASGSLTRSQLNSSSGAKTPISSLFSGLIVLAGAFALAPLIGYIPSASLAVVVVVIGISLLNAHQLRMVIKTTKSDSITFFVTFITGLVFALDFAIYLGAACSIALFIKKVANPEIVEYAFDKKGQLGKLRKKEERADLEVSIVHVEGELFFGAAELFRDQMRRVSDTGNLKVVIMKLRNAHNLDATSCMALEELIKCMNERDRILLVSEVRPDTMRILKNSGLVDIIKTRNLFPEEESNSTLSTAKALKRAKEIIGDRGTKVSIYAKGKR
ncbi:MAG: SulP family inorganic anion transporter [Opitutales bacterium]|nr:SulP family inorganic anion transporter [Opitutales bacterium]